MDDSARAAIRGCEVFAGLGDEGVAALAQGSRTRRLERGEFLFHRGDVSGGMFVLESGSVALQVVGANGREVVLDVAYPPAAFGELSIVDDGPRIASAMARERTVVVELERARVRESLGNSSVALATLRALATLVRRVDDQLADLVLLNLRGRVAKYLLSHTASTEGASPHSLTVPVTLRLNQTELGLIVGGSRPQLNKVLRDFEASGAIFMAAGRVVGLRRDLLARIVDEA